MLMIAISAYAMYLHRIRYRVVIGLRIVLKRLAAGWITLVIEVETEPELS